MARTRPAQDLQLDYRVYTADGEHLGSVKEIRREAFKIDAPWQRDYWISSDHVMHVVPGQQVVLDVPRDDLEVAMRSEPSDIPESAPYRARDYDETWRGTPSAFEEEDEDEFTGPDYLTPGRRWEGGQRRPSFRYGAWESGRVEPARRRRERAAREERTRQRIEPGRRYSYPAAPRDEDVPWQQDRQLTDESDVIDYGRSSRYRPQPGPAGTFPRYDQERGWGYQGQGGWSGRFGAPGTYSQPRGDVGFGEEGRAAYTGQPGRGYDENVWGAGQDYDTEAPRGYYAGKGPRSYRRPDASIREDVCEVLTDDGEVDASDIEVRVKDGEVILKGEVDSRVQKRRAEDLVGEIPGVRDVRNELKPRTIHMVRRGETTQGLWFD